MNFEISYQKKFGCKIFNAPEFFATHEFPNLRTIMKRSEHFIVILSQEYLTYTHTRIEMSEIFMEEFERRKANVIVIAREHLPDTTNDGDASRLLDHVPAPLVWRDYTPDVSLSVSIGRHKPSSWSSEMIHERKLFYERLEERLFGRSSCSCRPRRQHDPDELTPLIR